MQSSPRSPARAALLLLATVALLGGCASSRLTAPTDRLLDALRPYRMDIVQGNVVTREQVAVLKTGMTRAQVRDILGSPLLTDLFHADRWDYVFTIDRPGTPRQRRSVVVAFEGDRLTRVDASDLPSERDFVASISPAPDRTPVPVLELPEAQVQALPRPARTTEADVVPQATPATRVYPPLEPS